MARSSSVGTFWNANLREDVDWKDAGESASLYGDSDLRTVQLGTIEAERQIVPCAEVFEKL